MSVAAPSDRPAAAGDDARLASLGYTPQLNRVLGFFANFSVAFTYLSPMVGIYSLFVLGVGTGGPAYVWLTWIPVVGMLFVALVFGELASHYPVAGALYQYSKFSVGPRTAGSSAGSTARPADHGRRRRHRGRHATSTALTHNWFGWNLDPADHMTILVITLILLAIQTMLNITGARVMGRVAQFGVYVEIVGTLGIALILADPRLPPRARVPVLDPGRRSTRPPTRSASTSTGTGSRRGPDRRARAGLHLLRLRVGRGHRGGDEGRRPAGARRRCAGP